MSYSFIVRADTKESAKAGVAAELDKVVAAQPTHAADRAQAQAAADAFIDMLAEDDTKAIQANVHGSVSWVGTDTPTVIGAAVGVSVHYTTREEPKAVEDEAA